MSKTTWQVVDGFIEASAKPVGCGCDLHYVRCPVNFLEELTFKEVVTEMSITFTAFSGCPYQEQTNG